MQTRKIAKSCINYKEKEFFIKRNHAFRRVWVKCDTHYILLIKSIFGLKINNSKKYHKRELCCDLIIIIIFYDFAKLPSHFNVVCRYDHKYFYSVNELYFSHQRCHYIMKIIEFFFINIYFYQITVVTVNEWEEIPTNNSLRLLSQKYIFRIAR